MPCGPFPRWPPSLIVFHAGTRRDPPPPPSYWDPPFTNRKVVLRSFMPYGISVRKQAEVTEDDAPKMLLVTDRRLEQLLEGRAAPPGMFGKHRHGAPVKIAKNAEEALNFLFRNGLGLFNQYSFSFLEMKQGFFVQWIYFQRIYGFLDCALI